MLDDDDALEAQDRKTTLVVSRDQGKVLGNVNRIFVDRLEKRLAALSFRRKFLGKEYFLTIDQVESIGHDVIFVRSEAAARPLTKTEPPPGEDLRNLQGTWVFSRSGSPIAAITDVGFNLENWRLEVLFFCDRRAVKIAAGDLTIAADRLVVPDGAERLIFDSGEAHGLLAGIFGPAIVEEAAIILQRTLKALPQLESANGARPKPRP